jgi:hypothetical protein
MLHLVGPLYKISCLYFTLGLFGETYKLYMLILREFSLFLFLILLHSSIF